MDAADYRLADAAATEAFGARLAACRVAGLVVFIHGQLGAGKTTLVRGFLRGCGYQGPVKSPTYTLVEPYETACGGVYHLDLYRLADPEELEWIGIRDLFDGEHLCLIEWPEQGAGVLPPPDLVLRLSIEGAARRLRLESGSAAGREVLSCL
ncbi:MAG TPA: tRNA (adenosine(37)-N6)-threonylcarbamoyltransferase complex ATPase subunit type 1 TsaE [Gammaproteobacteria bacterium]|nr:tRNA (adenosine(37)-N6)-threonylcarbamoyltransferase complex ATPase subunit type 1 TsaE [Gammaproteobacteria bacterium]